MLNYQKNALLISRRYLKEVKHSMYWKNFNDANIKKGNWKISATEKDWMLRLAD